MTNQAKDNRLITLYGELREKMCFIYKSYIKPRSHFSKSPKVTVVTGTKAAVLCEHMLILDKC